MTTLEQQQDRETASQDCVWIDQDAIDTIRRTKLVTRVLVGSCDRVAFEACEDRAKVIALAGAIGNISTQIRCNVALGPIPERDASIMGLWAIPYEKGS